MTKPIIHINESCISIRHPIEDKSIFTIWREDFEIFRKAFEKCEKYHTELEQLKQKYGKG